MNETQSTASDVILVYPKFETIIPQYPAQERVSLINEGSKTCALHEHPREIPDWLARPGGGVGITTDACSCAARSFLPKNFKPYVDEVSLHYLSRVCFNSVLGRKFEKYHYGIGPYSQLMRICTTLCEHSQFSCTPNIFSH